MIAIIHGQKPEGNNNGPAGSGANWRELNKIQYDGIGVFLEDDDDGNPTFVGLMDSGRYHLRAETLSSSEGIHRPAIHILDSEKNPIDILSGFGKPGMGLAEIDFPINLESSVEGVTPILAAGALLRVESFVSIADAAGNKALGGAISDGDVELYTRLVIQKLS